MKKTNMEKLAAKLISAKIEFQTRIIYDTVQICIPSVEECMIDAICHEHSYGGKDGLIELMGVNVDSTDGVVGYLTSKKAFDLIFSTLTED